jgi:hypothetical protein
MKSQSTPTQAGSKVGPHPGFYRLYETAVRDFLLMPECERAIEALDGICSPQYIAPDLVRGLHFSGVMLSGNDTVGFSIQLEQLIPGEMKQYVLDRSAELRELKNCGLLSY